MEKIRISVTQAAIAISPELRSTLLLETPYGVGLDSLGF